MPITVAVDIAAANLLSLTAADVALVVDVVVTAVVHPALATQQQQQ